MKKIKIIEEGILEKNEMNNTRGGLKGRIASCDERSLKSCGGSSDSIGYESKPCLMLVTCTQVYWFCIPEMHKTCNSKSPYSNKY